MTKAELKARLYEAIDRRADDIIAIGERIRRQPEPGFKEVKTSRSAEETRRGLGLAHWATASWSSSARRDAHARRVRGADRSPVARQEGSALEGAPHSRVRGTGSMLPSPHSRAMYPYGDVVEPKLLD